MTGPSLLYLSQADVAAVGPSMAEILAALHGFGRPDLSLVTRGGLRFSELEVQDVDDVPLAELDIPGGALVLTVVRGEEVLLARGKTRIQQGDLLLLLLENDQALDKMRRLVNQAPTARGS